MFQNITRDSSDNQEFYDEEVKKVNTKDVLKRLFAKQNIILYIVTFMISMVGFDNNSLLFSITPFGLAIIAASLGNDRPIGIMYLLSLIGTFVSFGFTNLLIYFITSIVLFLSVLIIRPKVQEGVNEKKKVGGHLFFSVLIVQIVPMFFRTFYVFDLLTSIMLAITTYIFYKIFVNSITVIIDFGSKRAFAIEEVIGTSLLLAIAITAFENLNIFGFSIKNILSILIVLVLGWKNGLLVGATGGITIGVVLGVITETEPLMIAVYAVSGLIAGILNRFGRIGVIVGFALGNIVLAYAANGNTAPLIVFQEILIAALGLLAIPKNIEINIEDLVGSKKLLPETTGGNLEANQDTIYKLNSMSDTINDMAESYSNAAATILTDEELKEQEKKNIDIFKEELQKNVEDLEDNMLYEEIYNPTDELLADIFNYLLDNDIITEKKLVEILEKHNNYIVGFDNTKTQAREDVYKIVKAINYSYKISKMNFIWKKKLDESKKTVSSQLRGVSEAISKMAEDMDKQEKDEKEEFADKKQEILKLLEQKEIEINRLDIKQNSSGRYIVEAYTDICDNLDGTECNIRKICKIISKVLDQNMIMQKQECGLRLNKSLCKFTYISDDSYHIQIGTAKSTKADSPVSGDSSLETRLDDGKYLLALSDGMGSGPEAMKSSKIAIKMLERLLTAGFEKDVSLQLINSTLSANTDEDMYATLDIEILDLFNGNMEFIKNGACPTYVKRGNEVQLLKSMSLPTGIVNENDLVVYDYDLEDGDILVMCTDGIIDSNKEYLNKHLWLKYLLEDMETNDAQQIADIILKEAIDNDFGNQKDDMSVIVAKINKK